MRPEVTAPPHRRDGPAWASALGAIVVLLGVLAAAWHGNEWLKLAVVGDPPYSVYSMPQPDCERDELEEEGLTLDECYQLALHVHDISVSAAAWFPAFHRSLSAAGLALSLVSILAGIALVDEHRRAGTAAFMVLGALALLDLVSFVAVASVGPLLRQAYLWSLLLWFFIHLGLVVAALAGHHADRAAQPAEA